MKISTLPRSRDNLTVSFFSRLLKDVIISTLSLNYLFLGLASYPDVFRQVLHGVVCLARGLP